MIIGVSIGAPQKWLTLPNLIVENRRHFIHLISGKFNSKNEPETSNLRFLFRARK
jgi:hypothetical protein